MKRAESRPPPVPEALERAPAIEGEAIAGGVTDFSGLPLVGVRVEAVWSGGGGLGLLPGLSDGAGRLVLEGMAPGRYDLRFQLGRVKAQVLAVPTGTDQLRVRLARPQGILLVVKTAPPSSPPDLVHVVLERHTAKEGRVCEYVGRQLQMRMLLWGIRPGTYTVTAWGGPYVPVSAHGVEVREGAPAPEVELLFSAAGGTIRGVVRTSDGRPAADALLAWRRLDERGPWPRTSCSPSLAPDGSFLVRGLPAGRYRVSAGPREGPFADTDVEVGEEAEVDVVIILPAA
ncbi:MAG: carboxypeptidase-like regulatory domain-containing protein [Planctomycetota bacterium]